MGSTGTVKGQCASLAGVRCSVTGLGEQDYSVHKLIHRRGFFCSCCQCGFVVVCLFLLPASWLVLDAHLPSVRSQSLTSVSLRPRMILREDFPQKTKMTRPRERQGLSGQADTEVNSDPLVM